MDQTAPVLPSKHLTCLCVHCKSANAPNKVEYLYGDIVLMNAVCAACATQYWVKWDLMKLQLDQDEKDVEQFRAAMKLVKGDADITRQSATDPKA